MSKTIACLSLVYLLFVTFPSFGASLQSEDDMYPDFDNNLLSDDSSTKTLVGQYEDEDEDFGGPSSDFRPLGFDWNLEVPEYESKRGVDEECLQRKRSLKSTEITAKELCAKEKEFFAALPKMMRKFEQDLQVTLQKANLQGIITGRIKSLKSLLKKMNKDGVTDVLKITDIVGLRVTLQTTSDIKKFRKAFLKLFKNDIAEIRCYGTCGPNVGPPRPGVRIYWPWRGSGYRRLHFKVKMPSLKTEAEIQIGTPYMTLWAEWSHAVIYKGPPHLKKSIKANKYSQRLAEYYMILDNIRDRMNPTCPVILRNTKGKDIFSAHSWKIFGKPENGCNFWNDLRVDMP